MTIHGYARTSTTDQVAGLADQVATLAAAGCDPIWQEHVSSVAKVRPQLDAALAALGEGDTLVVTKPDRLARSVRHMLAMVDMLAARGVALRILSMAIDTGTPTGKLMLTILAGVAQWEREIMLERQLAGIARAKGEGKYRGRAATLDAEDLRRRMDEQDIDVPQMAALLGVHRTTVWRALRK